KIPGWSAQAVRPPNGCRIEDQVVLGPRVKGGGISPFGATVGELTPSDHFQTRNIRRVAMPLPAHQARNAVAVLHAGAGEEPVLLLRAGPVRAAGNRERTAGANQGSFVRAIVPQVL